MFKYQIKDLCFKGRFLCQWLKINDILVTYDNYDILMALYSLHRYSKSTGNNKEIDNCFYFTFLLSLLISWQRKSQGSFFLLMVRTNKTYEGCRTIMWSLVSQASGSQPFTDVPWQKYYFESISKYKCTS